MFDGSHVVDVDVDDDVVVVGCCKRKGTLSFLCSAVRQFFRRKVIQKQKVKLRGFSRDFLRHRRRYCYCCYCLSSSYEYDDISLTLLLFTSLVMVIMMTMICLVLVRFNAIISFDDDNDMCNCDNFSTLQLSELETMTDNNDKNNNNDDDENIERFWGFFYCQLSGTFCKRKLEYLFS